VVNQGSITCSILQGDFCLAKQFCIQVPDFCSAVQFVKFLLSRGDRGDRSPHCMVSTSFDPGVAQPLALYRIKII
jgi:hypothetical protein